MASGVTDDRILLRLGVQAASLPSIPPPRERPVSLLPFFFIADFDGLNAADSPSKEAPSALSSPEVQASWVGVLSPYAAAGSLSHSVMNGVDSDPASERNRVRGKKEW